MTDTTGEYVLVVGVHKMDDVRPAYVITFIDTTGRVDWAYDMWFNRT